MAKSYSILLYLLYAVLVFWAKDDIFFWDTVQLGSKHAHFFYDQGLKLSFLPDHLDSGHIPFFGFYLAIIWILFGKSLLVSHLAMLPFVLGIVYFTFQISKRYFGLDYAFFGALVLLSDPTLVAQAGLISPDVLLMCFFLGAFHFRDGRLAQMSVLFLCLLVLTSMRGMFVVGIFFLYDLYVRKSWKKLLKTYVTPFGLVLVYFLWHWLSKGWIGVHSDSPWAESFGFAGLGQMAKNVLVVGWRIVDFNRWIFLLLAIWFFLRHKSGKVQRIMVDKVWFHFVIALFVFSIPAIFSSSLSAHRYFLPVYFLFHLWCLRLWTSQPFAEKLKKMGMVLMVLVLWLGHLIVYPNTLSQGWDASLAHKPYFELRAQVDQYLLDNKIDRSMVVAAFPDKSQQKFYNLNEDLDQHVSNAVKEKKYVLVSNLYNEFGAIYESKLDGRMSLKKEWDKRGIYFRLYEEK